MKDHIFDANYHEHKRTKSLEILGKTKYILGFKCFLKDEFPGIEAENDENNSPVYSCKFGRNRVDLASKLALAYEDGKIAIQETKNNQLQRNFLIEKEAHKNAIFDISWVPGQSKVITAVADSTLCLWSIQDDLIPVQKFFGHTKSVKCVEVSQWDPNIFSSGGRDCNIIVWDTRCHPSNKANEIIGAHSTSQKSYDSPKESKNVASQVQNSIASVVFSQQQNLVSAGASDGQIKIWDLRKTYSRGKREPQSLHVLDHVGSSSFRGYSSMSLSPHSDRIYVSCLDGSIYAYHLANPTRMPVAEYFGHRANTYYAKMCLSPCGSYLLSGSNDDKAYVWQTALPGLPIGTLTGHSDEVTSVAWSSHPEGVLVTCSDDMNHRLFRPMFSDLPENDPDLRGYVVPYDRKTHSVFSSRQATGRESLSSITNHTPSGKLPRPQFDKDISSYHRLSPLATTPSSSKSFRCQVTPGTSERKILMSWLSSSKKTPQSCLLKTPTTSDGSPRKKLVLKRKLTDLIEENQENLLQETKSSSKTSPTKAILAENQAGSSTIVAKMLRYDQPHSSHAALYNDDDLEHFKFLDEVKNEFHSVTPNKTIQVDINTLLSSPTADLPNYVIDGRSPHNRNVAPVVKTRRTDWLTSLSQKKTKQETKAKPIFSNRRRRHRKK